MTNDALHKQAVELLLARLATKTESKAGEVRKSYNQRRKDATEKLRPVLTQIWDALARGNRSADSPAKKIGRRPSPSKSA